MTSPPPAVTFLLPVRNGLPFLEETLRSIDAQTFHDFEILAWDNGSTDDTIGILQGWIPGKLPGRVVTDAPFANLGGCLRAMVEEARSPLLARIDSDDICHPGRLMEQVAALRGDDQLVAVGCRVRCVDKNSKPIKDEVRGGWSDSTDIRFTLPFGNPLVHPAMVIRRSAAIEAGNYRDMGMGQDYDLWLRLSSLGRIRNLVTILLDYRIHGGSVGAKRKGDWPALHREMLGLYGEHFFPGITPDVLTEVWEKVSVFGKGGERSLETARRVLDLAESAARAPAWRGVDFLSSEAVYRAYRQCVPKGSPEGLLKTLALRWRRR